MQQYAGLEKWLPLRTWRCLSGAGATSAIGGGRRRHEARPILGLPASVFEIPMKIERSKANWKTTKNCSTVGVLTSPCACSC